MWVYFTILLVLLSINNLSITLYLHRVVCHRSIRLHPWIESFFRFALWTMTQVKLKHWVAVHRYHHHTSDTEKDPHSPLNTGFWKMLFFGPVSQLEKRLGDNPKKIIELYSKDIEESPQEIFYNNHPWLGKLLLLLILVLFLGLWAIPIWAVAINWVHITEERLHPALAHYYGYRNFNTNENSHNVIPWALIMYGEELHNNHHAKPSNWSFRAKWYEIDPGAMFAQCLIWLNLAKPTNAVN